MTNLEHYNSLKTQRKKDKFLNEINKLLHTKYCLAPDVEKCEQCRYRQFNNCSDMMFIDILNAEYEPEVKQS